MVVGRVAIFVSDTGIPNHAGFAAARRDPKQFYLRALHERPAIAAALAGGTVAERLRGSADLPTFLRAAAGPGWVLVGDAGHHKDPLGARGIADAFRDADLVAAAATAHWDGDLDAALADYPAQRDSCARPLSAANLAVARLDVETAA